MKTKLIFLLLVLATNSAWARIGALAKTSLPAATRSNQAERLSQALGQPLSPEQIEALAAHAAQHESQREHPILVKATKLGSRTLFCVGGQMTFTAGFLQAACVHFGSGQFYQLTAVVVGGNATLHFSVFYLTFTFDASRYAADFDPAPGTHALFSRGLTLAVGGTVFSGDAGNKSTSGGGVNIGLGVDILSVGPMEIKKWGTE